MTCKTTRIYAHQKLAFQQDLAADPTLTNVQKGLITTIATNFDPTAGHSPVSVSFMARGAGTTVKVAKRYAKALPDTGRVAIKRKGEGTRPTWWNVNWFFRGSSYVRQQSGGPVPDCRKPLEVPKTSPAQSELVVPKKSPPTSDAAGTTRPASGPQAGTESHLFPKGEINVPTPASAGGLAAPPGSVGTRTLARRVIKLKVTAASVETADGDTVLRMEFEKTEPVGEAAEIFEEEIIVESGIASEQDAGQDRLRELLLAADVTMPDDADGFVGIAVEAVDHANGLAFIPASQWGRKAALDAMGIEA